jgi:HemY protein
MRKLLVISIMALLVGASSIWLMQRDSGYILLSINDVTVEMTAWVGLLLYLWVTGITVWLILLFKWLSQAGGFRHWWSTRNRMRHLNKTAQGLILFADHDWEKARELLVDSAAQSSMPDVNLLFAARAAAENHQIDDARDLLERLRETQPRATLLADKAFAEILLGEENFTQAIQFLLPIAEKKPNDRGVLRLLADLYYLTEDWSSLQKILADLRRFKALNSTDLDVLEIDVYTNLLSSFQLNIDTTAQEKIDQVGELWELIPKKLRQNHDIMCGYFEVLQLVNDNDKLVMLLAKSINSQWNTELVRRLGEATSSVPEKQLLIAEKWLIKNPQDIALLTALGNICCQAKFWGKAKDYFASAVALQPSPYLYLKLSEVLVEMGDFTGSNDSCKRGLLLGIETQFNQD